MSSDTGLHSKDYLITHESQVQCRVHITAAPPEFHPRSWHITDGRYHARRSDRAMSLSPVAPVFFDRESELRRRPGRFVSALFPKPLFRDSHPVLYGQHTVAMI